MKFLVGQDVWLAPSDFGGDKDDDTDTRIYKGFLPL